jgi:Amt family ammonium transporter
MGGGLTQFLPQLYGVLATGAYVLPVSLLSFWVIKQIVGMRVSPQEELEGLDLGEHGNVAYPDFHPADTAEA